MTATRGLKIWTIITHALIIVGIGHGIAFIAIIELISLPYWFSGIFFNTRDSSIGGLLAMVGLSSLLGQGAIIYSILLKRKNLKVLFHIVGLLLLWTSIFCLKYFTLKDSNTQLVMITCLPFLICSIIFFAGQAIKRFYNWILDII